MNVAVFADLHGRLLLCLKLCRRWQRETGQKLDLILQAGDMGVFPNLNRLDRATLQHAQHDPTELGFATSFAKHDSRVEQVLAELKCNLVFVRGNHEDHQWLDELEKQADGPIFPVDVYQRVYCLKTGQIYHFETGQHKLNILGIGRIGQARRSPGSTEPIYIQLYEAERLFRYKRSASVDVLLTHDTALADIRNPSGAFEGKGGMAEIRQALNYYEPAYHFFGHVGGPLLERSDANGQTQLVKLTDLTWTKDNQQIVQPDSMGILRWDGPQKHNFEVVKDSWLQEYTFYNWEFID